MLANSRFVTLFEFLINLLRGLEIKLYIEMSRKSYKILAYA